LITAASSLFDVSSYALYFFGFRSLSLDWAFFVAMTPSMLYFVIPVGLWYSFGFSLQEERWKAWPGIRLRFLLLYLPAVLVDSVAFGREMRPGGLWGLFPYFVGINLISLGYLKLKQQIDSTLNKQEISGSKDSRPAIALRVA
jgi:hypothetical protein